MLEEYILFRAQQCIDGLVNYLKWEYLRRIVAHIMTYVLMKWNQDHSGDTTDVKGRSSKKKIFFFLLSLNWISYYVKILSYSVSNLPFVS